MAVWTKPEKERITYNQRKRKAIAESFRNILEEVTTLRTRLLPIEHTAEDRTNVIRQSLQMLLDDNSDGGSGDIMKEPEYEEISRETMDYVYINIGNIIVVNSLVSYFFFLFLLDQQS